MSHEEYKGERHARGENLSDDFDSSVSFVAPKLLDSDARKYDDRPQDAREWLVSFGHLKKNTDVSMRFLLTNRNHPSEKPYSMLPMLTRWLDLWFKKSQQGDATQRKLLSWLLLYTADYINLGHDSLDQHGLIDLCHVLHRICNNATVHKHIQDCLNAFHVIAETQQFPPQCLRDVLATLCSANIILEVPISEVTTCVQLLAAGPLSQETVNLLYDQLLRIAPNTGSSSSEGQTERALHRSKSNDSEISKYLTPARGAVRHLASLLEISGIDEKYVLRLPQMFHVMQRAAQTQIFRLSTEILDFCAQVLQGDRAQEIRTTPELFSALFDIINVCAAAQLTLDTSEAATKVTGTPAEDSQRREQRYRNDQEEALLKVKIAFIHLLPKMSRDSHVRVWDSVHTSLDKVPAEARQTAIDYARSQEICMPGRSDWAYQLTTLIDRVVLNEDIVEVRRYVPALTTSSPVREQNMDMRIEQRTDMLRLCIEAIETAAVHRVDVADTEADKTNLQIALTALSSIFHLYPNEKHSKVRKIFLIAIRRLAVTRTQSGVSVFADFIVSSLRTAILSTSLDSDALDEAIVAGTRTLREIFLESLSVDSLVAKQVYEALMDIIQQCRSRRSRLAAMSVLFRIRCNDSGGICIDRAGESAYIASAICKTDAALSTIFSHSSDTSSTSSESSHKLRAVMDKQLWVYPREQLEFEKWPIPHEIVVSVATKSSSNASDVLHMSHWLETVIKILIAADDWEVYSYTIVHLASQLLNMKLFEKSYPALVTLRKVLCERIIDERIMDPPADMGLRKSDVALCVYHILSRLIPYSRVISPDIQVEGFSADLVRAFVYGVDSMSEGSLRGYEGTARSCIHALSLCCFETPSAMSHQYYKIVDAMTRSMSQSHLVVHILEFLAQIARLPNQNVNFAKEDIKRVFAMCIQFLERTRFERTPVSSLRVRSSTPARHSGLSLRRPPYRAAMLQEKGLPQYSMALAYHTMFFWFLSLPIVERAPYVSFIMPRLIWTNAEGQETMDEQSKVFVDMMQRSAFSDLGETAVDPSVEIFRENAGEHLEISHYIVGHSIMSIEIDTRTGRSLIVKRQAAGTTYSMYRPLVQATPPHFHQSFHQPDSSSREGRSVQVLPSHTLLNMIGSAHPQPTWVQPYLLPKGEEIGRALRSFDRISDVDSHKIGIISLHSGQREEAEYLSNVEDTGSFRHFLDSLGTRMSLKPPVTLFKPFGLEYETDGTETIAWRDRVNEIVFAIASFMPNSEQDEHFVAKKQHLGNCHVLIVFNQSNQPWKMSMFASQVTLCNIVITPVNRATDETASDSIEHDFFQVEVLTKEEYQNISAAAEMKVVSKDTLAAFVRMLALNANIFSAAAVNTAQNSGDTEFPSSWRTRLQMIKQLRDTAYKRQSASGDAKDALEQDSLAFQYDFSRWTCEK